MAEALGTWDKMEDPSVGHPFLCPFISAVSVSRSEAARYQMNFLQSNWCWRDVASIQTLRSQPLIKGHGVNWSPFSKQAGRRPTS